MARRMKSADMAVIPGISLPVSARNRNTTGGRLPGLQP
jgi:hypothetical protein